MVSSKHIIRKFRKLILVVVSFTGYASIAIFATGSCDNRSSKLCGISNVLTKPAKLFLDASKDTKRVITNLVLINKINTSGLLAKNQIETINRFEDLPTGFSFNYKPGERTNAGYLLLARHNPVEDKPSIELWDLNKQTIINTYKFDIKNIRQNIDKPIASRQSLRFMHPLLLEDGSILVTNVGVYGKGSGPIIKLDKCGKYLSHNSKYLYHHSLEISSDKYIYAPTSNFKIDLDKTLHAQNFVYDGFAILDIDLNLKENISLLDIYKRNGLLADIYGRGILESDPFHLNDVQPLINSEGESIALISMRNHSRLMAIEVESKKVLWLIDRASKAQHDIDILDFQNDLIDISIFDNNTFTYSWSKYTSSANRLLTFKNLPVSGIDRYISISDPTQYELYSISYYEFPNIDSKLVPRTLTEGLSDYVKLNNSVMIEETNFGRLMEIDLDSGQILWQYLNRNPNGKDIYMMNWSRRIDSLDMNTFRVCNSQKS